MQMNVGDGKDPLKLGSIDDIANYFGFDKQSMGKENDQLEVNINTALSKLGKFTDVPYKMVQVPHQALKYTKEDDTIYCVAESDFGFTQQNPTAISRTLADKVMATKPATAKAEIEADQLYLSKGHYLVGTASEFEITVDKKIPIKDPNIKTLNFTDDNKTINLDNFAASDTDQYINKVKQSAWYKTETITKKYNNADDTLKNNIVSALKIISTHQGSHSNLLTQFLVAYAGCQMASTSWDQKDLFYFGPKERVSSDPDSAYVGYALDSSGVIVGLHIQAKKGAERVLKRSYANDLWADVEAGDQKLTPGGGDGLTQSDINALNDIHPKYQGSLSNWIESKCRGVSFLAKPVTKLLSAEILIRDLKITIPSSEYTNDNYLAGYAEQPIVTHFYRLHDFYVADKLFDRNANQDEQTKQFKDLFKSANSKFAKIEWSKLIDFINKGVKEIITRMQTLANNNKIDVEADLSGEFQATKKTMASWISLNFKGERDKWKNLEDFLKPDSGIGDDEKAAIKTIEDEALPNLIKIIHASILIRIYREKYFKSLHQRDEIKQAIDALIKFKYDLTKVRDQAKPTLPLYETNSGSDIFKRKKAQQKRYTDEAIAALNLDCIKAEPESIGYDVRVSATWPNDFSGSDIPFALKAINFRFQSEPGANSAASNLPHQNKQTITLVLAQQVQRASATDANGKPLCEISDGDTHLYVPNGTYLSGTEDEFVIAGIAEATRHAISIEQDNAPQQSTKQDNTPQQAAKPTVLKQPPSSVTEAQAKQIEAAAKTNTKKPRRTKTAAGKFIHLPSGTYSMKSTEKPVKTVQFTIKKLGGDIPIKG